MSELLEKKPLIQDGELLDEELPSWMEDPYLRNIILLVDAEIITKFEARELARLPRTQLP